MARCKETPDDIVNEINEIASSLSKEEKRFFDSWMLGSLTRQNRLWLTTRKRMLEQQHSKTMQQKLFNNKFAELQERARSEGWLATKLESEVESLREQAKNKAWKEKAFQEELTRERNKHYSTKGKEFTFALNAVDPFSVKEYGKRYNELIQATKKESLTDNEVRALLNRKSPTSLPELEDAARKAGAPSGISSINEAPVVELKADSFIDRVWGISEDAEREGMFKGERGKRNLERVEQLKSFLREHPHMMRHLDDLFISTTSNANIGRGGIGKSLDAASLEDIDIFLGEIKKVRDGSALREMLNGNVPIKKRYYFLFPESLTKITSKFDQQPRRVLRKVLTKKGPVEMEVTEFNSTFGNIESFMKGALEQRDSVNSEVSARVANRFLFMHKAAGKDADRMFKATVAKMEWDANKNNKNEHARRQYEAEWKRHKADYDELAGRAFTTETGSTKGSDLMGRVRDKIAEQTVSDRKRFIDNPEGEAKFIVKSKLGEIDVNASLRKMTDYFNKTGKMPEIGLSGVYKIMAAYKIEPRVRKATDYYDGLIEKELNKQFPNDAAIEALESQMAKQIEDIEKRYGFEGIGNIEDGYFPHMNWPKKAIERHVEEQVKDAMLKGASDEEIALLGNKIRRIYAEGALKDDDIINDFRKFILEPSKLSEETGTIKPGNVNARTENMIPDWDKSQKTLVTYGHKMNGAYHKMVGSLLSDFAIADFERRAPMGDTTKAWAKFHRLYVARSMGFPSVMPKEYLQDKNLKIAGNPYYYFTDHFTERAARSIDRKLFGNRMFGSPAGSEVGDATSDRFQRKARWLSNLEAKYEMLSLLSRPKTMINNFSQAGNTAISAGFKPFKNAMSMGWIKDNLKNADGTSRFNDWDDVRRWAESHGAVESFVIDEAGLTARFDGPNVKAWLNESKDYLKTRWKDGKDATDRDLMEIAKKYDISDNVMSGAAFFMRASERRLRMHSFMAHYIKAREAMDVNRFTHDIDDPWLIEMAKRGTTATQFMYNNAFRPAFANSSLGKVLTRFQQWSWRSIAFRKDIYDQAKRYGFREGTPEFDRFRRMATLDTLGFALAVMFPFSFFENTLPQPMGYLNDLSQYFLGQEPEDREKAFRGALPYPFNITGAVMPPIGRLATNHLEPIWSGSWDKYASYNVYNMFPFGLLARDVGRSVQNPHRFIETTTGFPLGDMHREVKRTFSQEHNESVFNGSF